MHDKVLWEHRRRGDGRGWKEGGKQPSQRKVMLALGMEGW